MHALPPLVEQARAFKVTQWRVIVSEWTKLRSLRSTVITLGVAIALFVGFGALRASFTVQRWSHLDPMERLRFDPVSASLTGVFLAQLAVGVLGVLIITGEYSTGMIRATFGAVPKRLPVLRAKVGLFAVVSFVLMLGASFVAFFVAQGILSGSSHHLSTTLPHPGVFRAVVGAAGYLTLVGLTGVGIGALLRNTAGAISTLAGLLFVLPILAIVLPQSWNDSISPYFPSRAGESLFSIRKPDPTSLAPGAALAVMGTYVVVIVALAAIELRRRDV